MFIFEKCLFLQFCSMFWIKINVIICIIQQSLWFLNKSCMAQFIQRLKTQIHNKLTLVVNLFRWVSWANVSLKDPLLDKAWNLWQYQIMKTKSIKFADLVNDLYYRINNEIDKKYTEDNKELFTNRKSRGLSHGR